MTDFSLLGVVECMPSADYHAVPALSASGLKRLRQSPLHFWAAQLDPNRQPGAPTPAMKAGTLAHTAVLEPFALSDRYAVAPAGLDGRTKEGKAWAASVPAGVEVVTAEQMVAAVAQAHALEALPEVGPMFARGRPELSSFWVDPVTGLGCKCRPDCEVPSGDGVIIIDVKTCQDASPDGFARAVVKFGYHLQAAWYTDGHQLASGRRVLGFVFAAVESAPPYAAAAYMLTDDDLDRARAVNLDLRHLYAKCIASGEWPGYSTSVQSLSLPPWAFTA